MSARVWKPKKWEAVVVDWVDIAGHPTEFAGNGGVVPRQTPGYFFDVHRQLFEDDKRPKDAKTMKVVRIAHTMESDPDTYPSSGFTAIPVQNVLLIRQVQVTGKGWKP